VNFKVTLLNFIQAPMGGFHIANKIIQYFLSSSTDYVFFENSSSNPYLIRRIEELNKVSDKRMCVLLKANRTPWNWSLSKRL